MRHLAPCLLTAVAVGCAGASEALPDLPPGAEAISLTGDTLYLAPLDSATQAAYEADLAAAEANYRANPTDADAIIWFGRRTAYLGRYRDAIAIYSEGLAAHPTDPRFLRHRGHRYLSIRALDRAIDDFQAAVEMIAGTEDQVEPDGLPNPQNIPTSTLHFNIWYHLGLAYYLKGDFARALSAYRNGMEVSTNPDALVAMSYWLYMTLRRLDRDDEAARVLEAITPDMELLENQSYHRLLLLNQGLLTPEVLLDTSGEADAALANVTVGYGVGAWHWYNDRPEEARTVWRRVVSGPRWAGFGYIAAEAELARSP